MEAKDFIQKAIVNAVDEKPIEFGKNMEKVTALKLKEVLGKEIKKKEANIFKIYK